MKQVTFELGAIACHCRDVYLDDPNYYDDYIPISMMGASNDFYNFIIDSYSVFLKEDGTTLKSAWARYNTYCDEEISKKSLRTTSGISKIDLHWKMVQELEATIQVLEQISLTNLKKSRKEKSRKAFQIG